jgi:Fe-S-cluster containining protein
MSHYRLAILGESPCHLCYAACCKQNGHDYAVLLEEVERRRFGPFAMDVQINNGQRTVIERVLPYRNGRCVFLGEDDRCTIYDDRPMNCRRFQCIRYFHQGGMGPTEHGEFLQKNRRVLEILESL